MFMSHKTKRLLLTALVFAFAVFGVVIVASNPALAQPAKEAACEGVGAATGSGCTAPGPSVQSIIATVIRILSIVVGVIAVIMIIIGGLRYITANGDSNSINAAKNTILYAIIGLVVAAMAQIIVSFVLNQF